MIELSASHVLNLLYLDDTVNGLVFNKQTFKIITYLWNVFKIEFKTGWLLLTQNYVFF